MTILPFPPAAPSCGDCGNPTKSEAGVCARCIRVRWAEGEQWPSRYVSRKQQKINRIAFQQAIAKGTR